MVPQSSPQSQNSGRPEIKCVDPSVICGEKRLGAPNNLLLIPFSEANL